MNKIALITGASGGIGYEFAKLLAKNNYDLVMVARNKEKLLEKKEELVNNYKINVKVIVKDLSLKDSPKEIYEEIKLDGINIDTLINNAGFGTFGEYTTVPFERQKSLVDVNVVAVMQLCYLFANDMKKKREGKILNVASIAAFQPGPYMSMYYASKAFILSFTESLNKELKKYNINVTALCPGPVKTNFESNAQMVNSKMFKILSVADPTVVAEKGYKALLKNKAFIVPGFSNKLLTFLNRLCSRKFVRTLSCYVNIGEFK